MRNAQRDGSTVETSAMRGPESRVASNQSLTSLTSLLSLLSPLSLLRLLSLISRRPWRHPEPMAFVIIPDPRRNTDKVMGSVQSRSYTTISATSPKAADHSASEIQLLIAEQKQRRNDIMARDHRPACAPSYVTKTCFSDVRWIYPVGLEHAGHHYWQSKIFPAMRVPKSRLSAELHPLEPRLGHSCHQPLKKHVFQRAFESDRRVVNDTANRHHAVHGCSVPCLKSIPDITMVARAAEAAQADLRIVLMRRDPLHIVHSCSEGCGFKPGRVRHYLDACHRLSAQLSRLDKRFFGECFDYEAYPNLTSSQLAHLGLEPTRLLSSLRESWRPSRRHALAANSLRQYLNGPGGREHASAWDNLTRCVDRMPHCRVGKYGH